VQNIFELHLHRIVSAAAQKFACRRAIYLRARRRRRTRAVARCPYFIDVFAICAQRVRSVAQLLFTTMSRAPCASLRARVMRNARRVYTMLSGVSVFFIAL
jgi:hypothetical protein